MDIAIRSDRAHTIRTLAYMDMLKEQFPNDFGEDNVTRLGYLLNTLFSRKDTTPFFFALSAFEQAHFIGYEHVSIEPLEPGHPDIPADIDIPADDTVICRVKIVL